MASNINTNGINTDYPTPGVDNSTEGFRTNFGSIKNNLDIAKLEIDDLTENVARTDRQSNFNGNQIADASLLSVSESVFDLGNIVNTTEITHENGSFQVITVGDNVNFTFNKWPENGNFASIKLAIFNVDNESSNIITFNTIENQTFYFDGNWPEIIILNNQNSYKLFEFTSFDGGVNIYAHYHGTYSNDLSNSTEVRNLSVSRDVNINGNLRVNGSLIFPDLEIAVGITNLQDVQINEPIDKQVLRYNLDTEQWENSDSLEVENIVVTVQDNGTGAQDEFFFDGERVAEIADFTLEQGKIYKFDLSDTTNSDAALRFSTTPDTSVPASITEYSENVEINGEAGTNGAYVQIKITEETPNPLYLWGVENQLDTSLIGGGTDGGVKIGIKRKSGTFDELKGTLRGGVIGENDLEIIDFENSVVVGNVAPSEFIVPNLSSSDRDATVPASGKLIFNTDSETLQIYVDQIGWVDV